MQPLSVEGEDEAYSYTMLSQPESSCSRPRGRWTDESNVNTPQTLQESHVRM